MALVGLLAVACSGGDDVPTRSPAASPSASPSPTLAQPTLAPATDGPAMSEVRLQLQWVPQAQFAGYFAAIEQGFYEAAGINVTIVPGGPDIDNGTAGSAADGPEFTISWVPRILAARIGEPASDLVNIAQIFQRSGTLSVSWKETGVIGPADFVARKVGVWAFGNEYEVTAAATKAGLVAGTDYEQVTQSSDMSLLLTRQIDVAEAMIYNEYAQVLEATNAATGDLYQATDLNVINYNDEGTAMLQDAIFARASWLAEAGNEAVARNFLKASFQGWIHCRDNPADCIQYTVNAGSTLGAGHQAWMMNEVNPLIWPSPNGIGMMDPTLWRQTVDVAIGTGIIREAPPADAYRTDLAEAALADLADADTKGTSFAKGTVEVTPGGS